MEQKKLYLVETYTVYGNGFRITNDPKEVYDCLNLKKTAYEFPIDDLIKVKSVTLSTEAKKSFEVETE